MGKVLMKDSTFDVIVDLAKIFTAGTNIVGWWDGVGGGRWWV